MKKRLLAMGIMAVCMAVEAWAQENNVKFSVNAGPQWNDNTGVVAGAEALIPFGESRWGFAPGLYWSFRNAKTENSSGNNSEEYDDKMHYLDIPLRLAVRVAGHEDGPFNLSLLFGPYIAYGLGGTSHSTIVKDGNVTKNETGAFSDEGRMKSRFDCGLNLGVSALIQQHFKVGVFSEIGLKDIYKQNSIAEELIGDLFGVTKINLGVGITVGYQF